MALGYDTYEDTREFETEEVRRYISSEMQFPCYILVATVEKPIQAYKINVLRQMFVMKEGYSGEEDEDSVINIYFTQDGRSARLGQIVGGQVMSFLKLFDGNEIVGYFDKDTELRGDYLYVLAGE